MENGYQTSEKANLSKRTIYGRMIKYGLSNLSFNITDQELDSVIIRAKRDFRMCGKKMIKQIIKQQGIKIQRWRLRDSIHRIYSIGVHEIERRRLHRRFYNVKGLNHSWHTDTNHKLVRWRFIIAGGGGYKRIER